MLTKKRNCGFILPAMFFSKTIEKAFLDGQPFA
jgi:hypothetical protein